MDSNRRYDSRIEWGLFTIQLFSSIYFTALGQPKNELARRLSIIAYDGDDRRLHTFIVTFVTWIHLAVLIVCSMLIFKVQTRRVRAGLLLLCVVYFAMDWALMVVSLFIDFTPAAYTGMVLGTACFGGSMLLQQLCLELVNRACNPAIRQSLYLHLKASKFLGIILTQMALPWLLSEKHMVLYVGGVALFAFYMGVAIVIRSTWNLGEVDTTDIALTFRDKVPSLGWLGFVDLKSRVKQAVKFVGPVALAFCLYWSQRGEYYYTYLFLRDDIQLTQQWIRFANGAQYMLFTVSLTLSGILIRRRMISSWVVVVVTLTTSIMARCFQIGAYELTSLPLWIISAIVSAISPSAGELLRSTFYAALGDSAFAGLTIYSAQTVSISALEWIYYWTPNPFVVTLCLITACLALILGVPELRKRINGPNQTPTPRPIVV